MRCPELIAREPVLASIDARLDRASAGRGGILAITGDAGVGKTRVAAELLSSARSRGMFVLSGRAVESASPVAYRPLTEAFLTAFRSSPPPQDASLDGFRGHLGRLVPAWAADPVTTGYGDRFATHLEQDLAARDE